MRGSLPQPHQRQSALAETGVGKLTTLSSLSHQQSVGLGEDRKAAQRQWLVSCDEGMQAHLLSESGQSCRHVKMDGDGLSGRKSDTV